MSYHTMVSCDDVFERLTSGPFPTRRDRDHDSPAHDQKIQRHIDACHECRLLAESLRPSLSLIHEAVGTPSTSCLPSYQSLGEATESTVAIVSIDSSSLSSRSQKQPWMNASAKQTRIPSHAHSFSSFGHVLAMLMVCIGFAAFGILAIEKARDGVHAETQAVAMFSPAREGVPSEAGMAFLSSLGVSNVCFEESSREILANVQVEQESEIVNQAEEVDQPKSTIDCCTECHSADRSVTNQSMNETAWVHSATVSASLIARSCSACHLE